MKTTVKRIANIIIKTSFIVFIFVLSLMLITRKTTEPKIAFEQGTPSFSEERSEEGSKGGGLGNPGIVKDFLAQKKMNPDTVGWLAISEVCYYPIMHFKDNEYYLKRDAGGKENQFGSIFLDSENSDFKNIAVLYGHNMNNGTMFGRLHKYKEKFFFLQNREMELFDGTTLHYYKPFTVLLLKGTEIINIDKHGIEKQDYIEEMAAKSIIDTVVSLPENPEIVFLSTCDYTFHDARLVVGFYKTATYENRGD